MNAIKLLLDIIVEEGMLSVNESQNTRLRSAIEEAYEQQKFQIIEAYEEGYNAAFHHEPSDSEKYYIEHI